MSHYARRKDGNQDDIAAAFREVGWKVHDTHNLGGGYPDLNVLDGNGQIHMVECKIPGETMTPDEEAFRLVWPVEVIRSRRQVMDFVNEIRTRDEL
jgi:hypothetical protein